MKVQMGCVKISTLVFVSVILLCSGIFGSFGLSNRREVRLLEIGKRYGSSILPRNIQSEQMNLKPAITKTDLFLRTKSDEVDVTEKRSDTNNGVWFGPRLGRTLQRNEGSPIWIAVDEYPMEQNRHSNSRNTLSEEEPLEEVAYE
ncbi:uncharacterized protein [Leptinotarsa decemlineata]|uniref:uncharacterized protein n=1 Tax=Leptinotarsa decemlineata TaxID=7539 RepID=UPI003D30BB4B